MTDRASVAALTESAASSSEPWSQVSLWAAEQTTADAVTRANLLDLACSDIPLRDSLRSLPSKAVVTQGGSRPVVSRPRILDLTSLWAGPLCTQLLGRCGAIVTKIESVHRPDGVRRGSPTFFHALHRDQTTITLDLASPSGRGKLHDLIVESDLVIESSRARAMEQLGFRASDYVDAGITWMSITAHGRSSNRIGFGDDVAMGEGLFALDGNEPIPSGDALADPLTGVFAAAVASHYLNADQAHLIDVSMSAVCLNAARGGAAEHTVWAPPGNIVGRRRGWSLPDRETGPRVDLTPCEGPKVRTPCSGRRHEQTLPTYRQVVAL